MAESGCLISSKLHALTINHNIKTKHFESNTTLDLSEGISVTDNITETDGNLIFKKEVVGESIYPDPDPDNAIFILDQANGRQDPHAPILRNIIRDTRAVDDFDEPIPFQGLTNEQAFGQLHTDNDSLRDIINPAGDDKPYTILQPANSILKNMYILVRNNNFSVTQSFGNESTGSGLRNYDLSESNVPNIYDNIGLRLNVSIGEESDDITENNFFEERDAGGDIVIVPGNYGDTSGGGGGGGDGGGFEAGATATNDDTSQAMPPNRRPVINGKREMFRHNGVLLGKDTLIPIITNYTFSSAQEKLHCINQNGYSGNYEGIEMDDIRMNNENGAIASLYNSSSTDRQLHVVIDASSSTLPTDQGTFALTAQTRKLTGADFTYLPNSLTQPRDTIEDKTYVNDTDKFYPMQVLSDYGFNHSSPDFNMDRTSLINGYTKSTYMMFKTGFASNLLRDNVYNSNLLKSANNGICTGLPANPTQSDYSGNSTPDFQDTVEFKIICDFQHLN